MSYKLQIEIGSAKFNGDGPEEKVEEHFKLFLDALKSPKANGLNGANGHKNGEENGRVVISSNEPIPADELSKVFIYENDMVSLKSKPESENRDADGLIMLLYGYKVLAQKDEVLSLRLKPSAIQSGLSATKPSTVLKDYQQYVRSGGSRRGSTYSLKNPGITKAEELIRAQLNS